MSLWLGILGSSLLAGGDFESIATVTVGSGGAADVQFTSIPSTYQHLQIRGNALSENTTHFQIKTNAGTGDRAHHLYGTGSSATASSTTAQANGLYVYNTSGGASGDAAPFIIDILDYAVAGKNRVFRAFVGAENNSGGRVFLTSGLWDDTTVISSITLTSSTGDFAEYATFALYGVKA